MEPSVERGQDPGHYTERNDAFYNSETTDHRIAGDSETENAAKKDGGIQTHGRIGSESAIDYESVDCYIYVYCTTKITGAIVRSSY